MAKYYIGEQTKLGQRLLDLSAIAGTLIENDLDGGVTKTRIIKDLEEIVREAKAIKNGIKNGYIDLSEYGVE